MQPLGRPKASRSVRGPWSESAPEPPNECTVPTFAFSWMIRFCSTLDVLPGRGKGGAGDVCASSTAVTALLSAQKVFLGARVSLARLGVMESRGNLRLVT